MNTINLSLLERTMAQIENEPSCFDNTIWGATHLDGRTTADFAGWATMLHDPQQRPPTGGVDGSDGRWAHDRHWTVQGVWMPAYAAQVLGLSPDQREVLFQACWSARQLRAGVDELVRSNGGTDGDRLGSIMEAAGAR